MSYLHIPNLYKDVNILEFRCVYAMEKIHGTSAHVAFRPDGTLSFFSGGAKHSSFLELFDQEQLLAKFLETFQIGANVTVYGEAYGGKMQGMKETYGDKLRFIAFDVKIGDLWLNVPKAEKVVEGLGLEFVHYKLVPSDLPSLDAERDADSVQAIRNGMGEGHKREGVVLRPPFEVRLNNGERLIAKHKRADFQETRAPRVPGEQLEVLKDAQKVADEWVTEMRLTHVLDKLPEVTGMESTPVVIKAMLEDVLREGEGEFEDTKAVRKAIGAAAAKMFKRRVQTIR